MKKKKLFYKKKNRKVETFSFVLTEQTGEKRYGYSRRFFGKKSECFCLVSFLLVPFCEKKKIHFDLF